MDGYCQAQAPIAAVLLMHMPAEQAFWCMVSICEKYLPGYYSLGLVSIGVVSIGLISLDPVNIGLPSLIIKRGGGDFSVGSQFNEFKYIYIIIIIFNGLYKIVKY